MTLWLKGQNHSSVCELPVCDWTEHGYDFNTVPSTIPRANPPELIMLHWTGGENGIKGFARTLAGRGIGTSFFVNRDGTIYQLVDPGLNDPRDVGGRQGKRTISIEIANYGFVLHGKPTKRGRDRTTDRERIHGMRLNIARFYPEQVRAVRLLCEALCLVFELPREFPRDRDGELALRRLRNREIRSFKGVCGHFHKTEQKTDPGFLLFYLLQAKWRDGNFDNVPERYDLGSSSYRFNTI